MDNNIENIIASCGAKLYDTETANENNQKIFRVLITCEGGVTLEKCEEVSRILSPIFDLNPPVSGHYFLEVSSPGIERPLKTPKHFQSSIGEKAKIKTTEATLIGTLISADETSVTIEADGQEQTIPYEQIKKARTYFEW
jgi:ribosome maturation factor RimP